MRERPDGADLLAVAREVLRRELLPLLPKEKAYDALMVANAMGIAERQLRQGEEPMRQEREALAGLLAGSGDLAALNREFARRIRAGDFDTNADAARILRESVLQRLRESAPKSLPPGDPA
jgi:hypothetical protein